ncbi:hypothetical protein LZZ85_03670 [Terrimonas sp. NA20]|uniref:Lipocalin-like domain-containing protein n=1 Tax=Terrimonas ginsenosidimutans TaxID=2908004 RepID=A0ABS9KM14_9BACT|nr:hypothetical protein [Terrimonas ginsenosidimutans]MCG2613359.1 hypothetical protein [Terrimonas ginsenosidimutans]
MRYTLILTIISASLLLFSCQPKDQTSVKGTWRSLWDKDMDLQLHLGENNQFKVVLNRTGQVHTNLGWYDVEDGILMIKDSIDYPLPVCNLADTGKYKFQITKDTIQFTVVDDRCERRSYALQLERFVRVN